MTITNSDLYCCGIDSRLQGTSDGGLILKNYLDTNGQEVKGLPGSVSLGGLNSQANQYGLFDDFFELVTGNTWTVDAIDSGSVSVAAAPGGLIAVVPSGGSPAQYDQTYLATTQPLFAFAPGQPFVAQCSLQVSEANTNQANVMFGLIAGGVGAGVIQDTGTPQASYTGLSLYKYAGKTVWYCQSSVGSTQNTTVTAVASGIADYQTLTMQWTPNSSTDATATFYIDGALVATQDLTYSGVTAMQLFVGLMNGSSTMESLYVDYIAAYQTR